MKKSDFKTIMRILAIYILFSVGIVGFFGVPSDDLAWFEWICVFLLSKLISAIAFGGVYFLGVSWFGKFINKEAAK